MQVPTIRPFTTTLPPMYAWPRRIKQILFAASVLAVGLIYALLAGSIITALVLLFNLVTG